MMENFNPDLLFHFKLPVLNRAFSVKLKLLCYQFDTKRTAFAALAGCNRSTSLLLVSAAALQMH